MKNLLIADAGAERLQSALGEHSEEINLYIMGVGGSITCNGENIDPGMADVHYGWFSHDVVAADYTREYAVQMLKAPNLEWVQSLSAGLDDPFFAKLAEKQIRLTNSNAQAPAIAEYVVASVLDRYQGFAARRQYQTERKWEPNNFRELFDSNWLIIGYGNIGQRVGERAKAFEANVIGVKRSATNVPGADEIITYDQIKDVLPEQDVVVLACALTDDTRDMVDASFMLQMKADSILVNIGRGDLVIEEALLETLDQGAIDYAVLDVFRQEPLPEDSPFWHHPRVLVTPHSSNRGHGTHDRGDELFLHNLKALVQDTPLKNEVDVSSLL
jgi:phosphoglycerate dehydrogenase-like enzyme